MIFLLSNLLSLFVMLLLLMQGAMAKEITGISNYSPSTFIEQAESPFFYSIGKQLKYGFRIDENASTLFDASPYKDEIFKVYPSPDNQKVVIVANKKLYLVKIGKPTLLILNNLDHYAPRGMADGASYFKFPSIQWHPNSRFIYIAKDKKQKQVSDQSFSKDATLVRVDIENINKIEDVTPDFRSNYYYFVGTEDVCFNYAPGDGSVIWKCSSTNGISKISSLDSLSIRLENGVVLTGQRFLSYQSNIHESAVWMTHSGFSMRKINDHQDALFERNDLKTPLLMFNVGENIKGNRLNGIMQTGGSVLPGERYLLLNMYSGAVKGQILFDRMTRQYRKLPEDTHVHRNLNSTQYKDFVFSADLPSNSFKPNAGIAP